MKYFTSVIVKHIDKHRYIGIVDFFLFGQVGKVNDAKRFVLFHQ